MGHSPPAAGSIEIGISLVSQYFHASTSVNSILYFDAAMDERLGGITRLSATPSTASGYHDCEAGA